MSQLMATRHEHILPTDASKKITIVQEIFPSPSPGEGAPGRPAGGGEAAAHNNDNDDFTILH